MIMWNASTPRIVFSIALVTVILQPGIIFADDDLPSIIRGGRLYDNWFVEIMDSPPESSHPAYPVEGVYANEPATNWRCKECHGWDYKGNSGAYASGRHATGIKGIRSMAGKDPALILSILKNETHAYVGSMQEKANAPHAYGGLMDEQDLMDLANFVSLGQVDMDFYIHPQTKIAKGHTNLRQDYYKSICAACHGLGGRKLRTMPPLGEVARKNPWLSLHKMLNGHPGEQMPTLSVLDPQILVDILAYVQTLGEGETVYSIVRGGRLYDNWRKELREQLIGNWSRDYPANKKHPAYPVDKEFAKAPKVNWRCKECHGWDYLGRDGSYGQGRHFTGIKGIRHARDRDLEDIMAILRDDNHVYGEILSYQDFRDLAIFVSLGQVDMDRYIDRRTALFKGDKEKHKIFYNSICATCHGADGQMIRTTPLREAVRVNPWQSLHKLLNGHPDEAMPALRVLGMETLADILTYVQSLPPAR